MAEIIELPALAFAYSSTEPTNTSGIWYDLSVNSSLLWEKLKVFNKSSNSWEAYTYSVNQISLNKYIPLVQKGVANGVATLGSNGLVPPLQLGTGTPSGLTYLRGDGTWQAVSGLPFVFDLNGQTGGSQSFATVSDTNITLTENSAANIHTFTAGWTGVLSPARGGTGVNNGAYTTTLTGNFATAGGYGITLTASGATNVTLPTSGTLISSAFADLNYAKIGGNTLGGSMTIGTSDAYDFVLKANNNARVTIASGGNITLSPSQTVFVGGRAEVTGEYVLIGNPSAQSGRLGLFNSNHNFLLSFYSNNAQVADNSYYFPTGYGSAGQALTTDGAGNLTWSTVAGATPTLNAVLTAGNTTGGKDVVMTAGDFIYASNLTDIDISADRDDYVKGWMQFRSGYAALGFGLDSLKFNGSVLLFEVPTVNINPLSGNASLRLYASNGNYIQLSTPNSITSNYSLNFPSAQGAVGEVLVNDGSGNLSWGTGGGAGTVTTVSVVTANGFAGTVANATTTPAITLTTSVTGILKGNGTAISAAVAGTDYVVPGALASYVPYTGATSTLNLGSQRLVIGTGADPIGDVFAVTKNVIGGVYGSVTNDHANGISGFILGQTSGDYLTNQYYGPSRVGNFNGTSVPFANLSTTVTALASTLNGSPYLIGGSILYNVTGTTASNAGTRLDTIGLRVGTLADIHTANTARFQVPAGTTTIAPFKFTSGTNLTTPEAGAVEYDGTYLYYTDGTAARRTLVRTIDLGSYQPLDATLTALAGLATGANKIPYSTGIDVFSQLDFNQSSALGTSTTTVPSESVVSTAIGEISAANKLFNYYNFI